MLDAIDAAQAYEIDPAAACVMRNLLAIFATITGAEAASRRAMPTTDEISKLAARYGKRGAARRLGVSPSTICRRLQGVPRGTPGR